MELIVANTKMYEVTQPPTDEQNNIFSCANLLCARIDQKNKTRLIKNERFFHFAGLNHLDYPKAFVGRSNLCSGSKLQRKQEPEQHLLLLQRQHLLVGNRWRGGRRQV